MTVIAPILEQSPGKIRFRVDNVKPTQKPLSVESAKSQIEKQFEKQLLAFSHDDNFLVTQDQGINLFVTSVHAAFSEHRPLLITPDIIWITLAQGFAQHINNNGESLRSLFVRHQGKQKLHVEIMTTTDKNLSQSKIWREAVQDWCLLIRDHARTRTIQTLRM